MKKILLFALMFVSINMFAQIKIECKQNEVIDKRVNCFDCGQDTELFSGILVTERSRTTKIYAPYKVKFISTQLVNLIDAYGNTADIRISNVIGYSTKAAFLDYIKTCIPESSGGGGLEDGDYGAVSVGDNGTSILYNDGTILGSHIADGNIFAQDLAVNSVPTDKIVDRNVIRQKIGLLAVGNTELGDLSISSEKFIPGSVDATAIGSNAVGSSEVIDLSLQTDDYADNSITGLKIASSTITDDNVLSINGNKIVAESLGPTQIGPFAIGTSELNSLAVTGPKIANQTIDGGKLVLNTINPSDHLTASGVSAGSFTNTNITVNAQGIITAASNGAGGAGLAEGDYGDIDVTAAGAVMTVDSSGVTAGSYTNADITVGVDGRITLASNGAGGGGSSAVFKSVASNIVYANGQVTQNITGLTDFEVVAGTTYKFTGVFHAKSTLVTSIGLRFGFANDGGAVGTWFGFMSGTRDGSNSWEGNIINNANLNATTTQVATTGTVHTFKLEATFICTTSGNIDIQNGAEVSNGGREVYAGSYMIMEAL